jgi:dihydropyrimidinase
MTSLLIKNGHVVTAGDSFEGDILISEGKIQLLGKHLEVIEPDAQVVDAAGLYVLPGGIDAHVHMELPIGGGQFSADDFETGTRAAIAGGTTSIIDFVTPEPGQSLIEALHERKEAAKKSLCDYGLHMSITSWNQNIPGEMRQCVEQEGIPSFKVYMAYKETIGLDDEHILAVMRTAAKLKARVAVHCEYGEIIDYLRRELISQGRTAPKFHPVSRPVEAEKEAVIRALMMAWVTKCPLYIVHVSTRGATSVIAAARRDGQDVAAETCPQYLVLDEMKYGRPGFESAAYVMSPPLRSKADKRYLWRALGRGHFQTVATDHCPFNMKGQRDRGIDDFTKIPNGAAGVEHRMALLYTYGVLKNKISLNQWAALTSTAPAKIFGLYPKKGTLLKGADADILLWDPGAKHVISAKTHRHNCDTSIYEGIKIKGKPYMVIVNGKIAYENATVNLEKGAGNYLYRK